MTQRRNPAVMAGLLGGLMLAATPTSAHAATFELSASPALYAVVGVVGGLSFVGMVSGIAWLVEHHSQQKAERAFISQSSDLARQYENNHSHALSQDADKSMVIAIDESRNPITEYKPRHMRAQEWNDARKIRVQSISNKRSLPALKRETSLPAQPPLSAHPKAIHARSQSQTGKAAHVAKDYEQVAENYLKLMSFRERMASRARGAAEVLRERLGGDPMEGLPVIPRADGTVGDVGTSWWVTGVGEKNIAHDFGITTLEAEAIPDEFSSRKFKPIVEHSLDSGSNRSVARNTDASISGRVAFVDQGIFPEKRTVSELSQKDDWELALDALDAKLDHGLQNTRRDPIEVISGAMGNTAHDEVLSTSVVSDAADISSPARSAYIEHLVADVEEEMRQVVEREEQQRPTRELFRLIDGGTNSLKRIPTPAGTAAEAAVFKSVQKEEAKAKPKTGRYCPKHFSADMQEAIEA